MMKNQDSLANLANAHAQSDPARLHQDMASLHIGNPIQLQIENKGYVLTLIGYLEGEVFMVTTPTENGSPIQLEEGQPLVVRYFSERRAHEFSTEILYVATKPFPHLHLAYPQKIHILRERQHDRLKINITGNADISNGKSYSCVIHDISMGGALISLTDQVGDVNDKLRLTLNVVVSGVEYSMILESEIRFVRIGASSGISTVMQGLSFNDLSKEEILALAAFELLPDWNTTS